VTVTDDEDPTITCPADVSVSTGAGTCTATGVALGTPTTADNCSIAGVTNDATEPYALGNTTVTWTVTDGSGNTATCTQTVTVIDNIDPTITCPADTIVGECNRNIILEVPVVSDNCGIDWLVHDSPYGINENDASGEYPAGTTVIIWTVADIHENSNTDSMKVTILKTPDAPEISDKEVFYGEPADLIGTAKPGHTLHWYATPDLSDTPVDGNQFQTHETEPGEYTYYVTQTTDITGCESKSDMVHLLIVKAQLTVIADDQVRKYGEANTALTFSYSGFVNSEDASVLDTETIAATAADATSGVGDYAITVSGGVDDNYDFSYTTGTLTVNKAILTVTADNKSKIYGEENPALTFVYSGFENGDAAAGLTTEPTATTTVNETTTVGTYAGSITLAGGVDENYSFTYVAGDFEVTKKGLTVTADNKSKIYGEANPALTFVYSGFENGDDASNLDTEPTASTTTDGSSEVGDYVITVSSGVDNNYNFSYTTGTFTVNKVTLSVTADDKSKICSETNPVLTVHFSGFVNGDDASVLDTMPTATTINSDIDLYPSVMTKMVTGAPPSVDISATALYQNKIGAGLMYRFGASIGAMVSYEVTDNIRVGYSYDMAITRIHYHSLGTHEIMLTYNLGTGGNMLNRQFYSSVD
jgi:hypothetical protein